jgi:hypothetical protein
LVDDSADDAEIEPVVPHVLVQKLRDLLSQKALGVT